MRTCKVIPPSADLIEKVFSSIHPEGKDYSRSAVIFQGKRPSHALRRMIAKKEKTAFIPPQIFSIDLFVDHFVSEHLHSQAQTVSQLDAAAALFELAMQVPQAQLPEFYRTIESFLPLGMLLFQEFEEMKMASVSEIQLLEAVASVSAESAHLVAALYAPFYKKIADDGMTTRAVKYSDAADKAADAEWNSFSQIIVAGFHALTPVEKKIFTILGAIPQTEFIFQSGTGIGELIEELKFQRTDEPDACVFPQYYFYEAPDAHGELFALNRIMQESFPGGVKEPEDAVIILPRSENLFALYHQSLAGLPDDSYNIAAGYPLERTPIFGYFTALCDASAAVKDGEIYAPAYLRFLLHPYTKNILFGNRTDVTRIIIHAIEEEINNNPLRKYIDLSGLDSELIDSMVKRTAYTGEEYTAAEMRAHLDEIHKRTIETVRTAASVGRFAQACLDVIEFLSQKSTAWKHPFYTKFVQAIHGEFTALRDSALASYSFRDAGSYKMLLNQVIAPAEVPFPGTPYQGLQTLGFLEARGMKFKKVFMLDVNDDVMPGRSRQDILLPAQTRRFLQLPLYKDRETMHQYVFETVCAGAEEVHFFSINSPEKERSRYLARIQWQHQHAQKSPTINDYNLRRMGYSLNLGIDVPAPKQKTAAMLDVVRKLTYSSTSLDAYLKCGLKFYYAYVLKLREKKEIVDDVDSFQIGNLLDAVLYKVFAPFIGTALDLSSIDDGSLEKIVDDVFLEKYGNVAGGEQFFVKLQISKRIRDFIEHYQKPRTDNYSIVIQSLQKDAKAEIDGISFTGKADRIETRNGELFILDYKSGADKKRYAVNYKKLNSADRQTWKESIKSLQLPLYIVLAAEPQKKDIASIRAAYLFLGKNKIDNETEVDLFEGTPASAAMPALREIIFSLVKETQDEMKPFAPTEDFENDCPDCAFKDLCGTQWVRKKQ